MAGIEREKARFIVDRLWSMAKDQETARLPIEQRWLANMRQFYGKYDEETMARLEQSGRSKVFVNITRPKVMTWTGRIMDLMFPAEKKPWKIEPTPIPQGAEGQEIDKERAEEAAKRMERLIDDQFVEAGFASVMRRVIFDGVRIGTGIIKGPVVGTNIVSRWTIGDDGAFAYQENPDIDLSRPSWTRVDPWNWFPDMSARRVDEAEFFFERHIMTSTQLRKYAKSGVFYRSAVESMLASENTSDYQPSYLTQLRSITGGSHHLKGRYIVWEFRGRMSIEDIDCLCKAAGDKEFQRAISKMASKDPFDEISVVVWFSETEILMLGLHPLMSDNPIYSVFNFAQDESSIFGFGLPHLIADAQAVVNSAWRGMMDNAAITTGGQIVVDMDKVEPADGGSYRIEPFKIWARKGSLVSQSPPFQIFEMNSHQIEFANIISLAKSFADEESQLPLIVQGEQSPSVTKVAFGMSLLMNAANVVFRNIVRQLDDDIVVPCVTRAYEWNMQFIDDDSIKGDLRVRAIGSSVLLVQELQAQNYMAIAVNFAGHPVFGPMFDQYALMQSVLSSNSIAPSSIMVSKEEYEQLVQQQMQMAAQQQDQDTSDADVKVAIAQLEADTKLKIAQIEQETALIRYATQNQMKLEELRTRLDIARMSAEAEREKAIRKERQTAAEFAIKNRFGSGI